LAACRGIEDLGLEEDVHALRCRRHVRAFGHNIHACLDQVLGVLGVISFCVALGKAQSALMFQSGLWSRVGVSGV